jgi:carboxypeptidase family protein
MKHPPFFHFPAVITLLVAGALTVFGQTAQVTGRVSDPNGAVVSGAKVTITNVGAGINRETVSNDDGFFSVPLLQPGEYRVIVQRQGFKPLIQSGIILQVDQSARFDFRLEVGATSEEVKITSEGPLLERETSSLGQVIDEKRVVELPLNGRNPLELSRLSPGVNLLATSFLDTRNFNLTSVSINGGQGGTNAVLLDGGSSTLPERNEFSVAPNVDAVQEFKVQTNSLSAEFGMTGGGVINLVTKSGTNQFRGALFEFLRNDKLDANSWTNNRNGLDKSPLRYNQFGGSVGGPILMPGKLFGPVAYDGHNRSFFFFNYEGIRYRSATTALTRVPTELERQGDFSQTFIRAANGQFIPVQLYDPATTAANPAKGGSGFVRAAFPSAVIPASRIDPAALKILQYYPLPNRAPDNITGTNNYIATPSTLTGINQYNVRFDHQITQQNKLFARYSQSDAVNTGNPPLFDANNIADPSASLQTRNNKSLTIGDTHAFSARLLNEFRFSISRQYLLSAPPGYNVDAASLLGLPSIIPNDLFPRFNVSDVQAIGSSADQLSARGLTVGQINDTVSFITGRHNLKAGVDLRAQLRNNAQSGPISGSFDFSRGLTGNPQNTSGNTGFGLATFLLGAVSGGSISAPFSRADSFRYYAGFFQDDYHITSRLTLNLGVRYDVITPPTDRFDRYSNFNPTATNPVTGSPGVLQYSGVDFGRQAYDTDFSNIGPRVGFAFDVFGDGKTVVRGGYGIFYFHTANYEYPDMQGFSVTTPFQSVQGAAFPVFQLSGGPSQIQQPAGSSLGPLSFLGNNVTYFERNRNTPTTQQWNLNLQRELPGQILLDAAYAGSHGTHLIGFGYNLNQLDPQYLSLGLALDDRVPNPLFGKIPAGTPLSGSEISRRQSLLPFPGYLAVNVSNPPLGSTIYHSAQLKAEKRFSRGLSFLSSYTFSKLIGDVGRSVIDFASAGGAPQNSVACGQDTKFDRRSCRSIEPQDITHLSVTSAVYELPVGKGKRFLSSGGALSRIIGNWQINGILTLRSGLPLIVRGANNGAADRPNMIGSAKLDDPTIDRWFDTGAFTTPPQFTYGNTPRTLPDVRGPGFASFDFSLAKNLFFTETIQLQFRSEFFNLFNRVNYNQPDTSFTSGNFGRITSAGDPRRIQFGLKLYF